MNWIIVKKVSLDTDLSMVVGYLRERGITHQVYEEAGEQIIAVTNPHIVGALLKMLDEVERGTIQLAPITNAASKQQTSAMPSFLSQMLAAPVTSLLILLSVLGACLIEFDVTNQFIAWFSFQNFTVTEFNERYFFPVSSSLQQGEIWRLITPVFLHFGFFHVLFNSMWMWDLGRRLEFLLGRKWYLIFFVTTAIASNFAQYLWSEAGLFGGMSGVVYACVGFVLVSHRLMPHPLTAVAPGVLGFMLLWLAICATGAIDHFVGGSVANAAHVGGLLAGAAFAFCIIAVLKKKYAREKN